MKILVFGSTGQVATELRAKRPDATFLSRQDVDLASPKACATAIGAHAADVIINAAAYTAVDRAEEEEALATLVNGDAPIAMAEAAAERNLPFLHISTDYVFSGKGERAWKPDDQLDPQNAYGRSKLKGEIGIRNVNAQFAILRTSWVVSAHGNNFVKTMLRLSESRDTLNVVDDQIGGPTAAGDIADALLEMAAKMVRSDLGGTFHFAGSPAVSWKDFASEIFRQSGREMTVNGIPTSAYPTPAARPLNSRMDCSSLEDAFGIPAPDWKASLSNILNDLGARA